MNKNLLVGFSLLSILTGCSVNNAKVDGFNYENVRTGRIETSYRNKNITLSLKSVANHDISDFNSDIAVPVGTYDIVFSCHGKEWREGDISTTVTFNKEIEAYACYSAYPDDGSIRVKTDTSYTYITDPTTGSKTVNSAQENYFKIHSAKQACQNARFVEVPCNSEDFKLPTQ